VRTTLAARLDTARRRMALEWGWHQCADPGCLTMIGDSRSAVLCAYCVVTRRLARGMNRDGTTPGR
jgi:hypothetical protein